MSEELPILKAILKGNVNYHNAPVRFGRVPKREKARILAAMQQSTQNRGQQRQLATELDDQPRLLAAVLRAHMETCEFTKEKVAAMRQRARECPSYSMPTLLACPLNPAPELQSEQEFSERFAHVIRGVIDFAGMIPGFQLLNQDDKFTLLKAGLFDALFVRLICMFDSSINSIICLNGQVMRRDAIQNGANARFLVDSTFNFAERMNSMNLSDAEIGLFCAIVLITPDRPGLRNIELIDKMYSRLKGCLQTIINQNRPDQPDFMSELLKTLPDLRTLSTLHTEKLVVFRTEHKELLRQQMWQMEDDQPSKSPGSSGSNWDDRDRMIDDMAKSPMGSVSSTESGDIGEYSPQHHHHHHHYHGHNHHHHGHQSSLASSAPLLAATLSGTCPLRHRANSGSSAEDIDVVVGSHAHLTQNGLTITPVARSHSTTSSTHLLHHHLSNGGRYRKLDSPTDSGIESGNEKAESTKTVSSGGGSSCSSPRSSVDDALDAEAVAHVTNGHSTTAAAATTNSTPQSNNNSNASNGATKRQIVEDMPVLKRVLQAPPLYDTNSLMDEAYKPHKKFRALRHRDYDSSENDPHTTSTTGNSCNSSGAATSTTTPPIVQITPAGHSTSPSPSTNQQSTTTSSASPTTVPQNIPSPSPVNQQQSQLHMHLTRNLNTTTNNSTSNSNNLNSSNSNSNNNYNHHNNSNLSTTTQSTSAAPALSPQIPTNQQQHSSLSSTHSVLAKSLMAEPRMTPEQIKRSDIIQNYIMRGSSSSPNPNGLIVAQTNNNSNPPSQSSHNHHHHHYQPSASPLLIGNAPTSPSTTTVTLSSPPPPSHQHQQQSSGQQQHTMRWQGQSVITTTTLRQQSVSPHSNSSSCSNGSTTNSSYFQSPHSTSVSPPRPSPSATHSPRLIELQVDIADSQQPLNLSKKSPTPPPPLSVTTVSSIQQQQQHVQKIPAALVAHKYPSVSPDVTVTAATPNCPQVTVSPAPSPATTTTIHKVLLEA
ncbi:ecdysone-inducible protein E75-like [Condylostylus longicornis]|uniref:ecdysone-inducible protein E75-like n=1 Tax=Condylostylus longicornis TaxID=2530218 RepID=UPI00244E2329|nr:ecdysone-inducible protein E75-like [Condylostylus longicornis]